MKAKVPASVTFCHGPAPLLESEDFSAYSEGRKAEILRKYARAINERERAMWEAAGRLSSQTKSQSDVYGELLFVGREYMKDVKQSSERARLKAIEEEGE